MLQQLRNLWAWSKISPYEAGKDAGKATMDVFKEKGYFFWEPESQKSEIVYPNRVVEVLRDNPNADLDDLITR